MQQLTIPAANVADLLANGYTTIEVWAASDYNQPFYEITAASAQAAKLTSAEAQTTFRMGGHTLKVSINGGAEQSISFDQLLDLWTPAQVAARINQVVPLLATVVGMTVVLTAPTTGRVSTVLITYSSSPNLGWKAGDLAHGLDARIALVGGTFVYSYSDLGGSSSNLYKTRFSAGGVNPISDFSAAAHGAPPPVSGLSLSIATATFADASGRPLKRKVIIAMDSPPIAAGTTVVGSIDPIVVESDDNGFFQVSLVQGMQVQVAIEGTNFVRRITVPATATFDLLAAMSAAPDPFTVQTVPPLLIRRNI